MHRPAIKTIAAAILVTCAAVYGGDYLRLRVERLPLGSVAVKRLYEVKLKNRKTEYLSEEAAPAPCVHSLLPQMGYAPCWYLSRHRVQRIQVDAGRPAPLINTP